MYIVIAILVLIAFAFFILLLTAFLNYLNHKKALVDEGFAKYLKANNIKTSYDNVIDK